MYKVDKITLRLKRENWSQRGGALRIDHRESKRM